MRPPRSPRPRHPGRDFQELAGQDLVLGSGPRLFADGGPVATLRLLDSVTATTSVMVATYQPTRTDGGKSI